MSLRSLQKMSTKLRKPTNFSLFTPRRVPQTNNSLKSGRFLCTTSNRKNYPATKNVNTSSSLKIQSQQKRSYITFSVVNDYVKQFTPNLPLQAWIRERIQLFQPYRVHLCDGSQTEFDSLMNKMIAQGTVIKLNEEIRPNSYLARSTISDVARVEERTYICSETQSAAGPLNIWSDPEQMQDTMNNLFRGAMRGRTMYVVPFCMGPVGSKFSQYGVQVTDSPYVVTAMRTMTRMGKHVLDEITEDEFWVPCVHSVGVPTDTNIQDTPWPCNDTKYIVHFPEERRIWSYGSGYGGNAILGKKCLALRIASVVARDEGWLAEHALIVGVTNPEGKKKYFIGCFPSACGKTNLAMLESTLPGWKIECVGDDIAWLRFGRDGRLYAINPEFGFFGVAPGTSMESNPNMMRSLTKNTVFTNCAVTRDFDVWWEGLTDDPPNGVISWTRQEWGRDTASTPAAHPNARFCVPLQQCPVLDPEWNNPFGVPISGILLGGRRSTTVPLVYQARNWQHGVFMGSSMASETTAAAAGRRGVLRVDPFSMRPFCGYNMADYFQHWLDMEGKSKPEKMPKIFAVNWFHKHKQKFLWPGFGENIRVLKWIFERCDQQPSDTSNAEETSIGYLPKLESLDMTNLNIHNSTMQELLHVDKQEWTQELATIREFYGQFGDRIPQALVHELNVLKQNVEKMHE